MTVQETAFLLRALGYRVVPVRDKRPRKKDWATIEWTDDLLRAEFDRGCDGVGLILDGVIDFDFDGPGAEDEFQKLNLPDSVEWRSARGRHILYRGITPCQKLGDLEIRSGPAKQSLIPPSGGREWIASLLDVEPVEIAPIPLQAREIKVPLADSREQEGPGREFNRRATWAEILEPHGYKHIRDRNDGAQEWLRPGGDKDLSCTTGFCRSVNQDDKLYAFSTNMPPFEAGESYSKFAAFCLLNHDGDYSAAAAALAAEGFVEAIDARVFEVEDDDPSELVESHDCDKLTNLLLFPGFVSDVAAWHMRRSQILDPQAGALAGVITASWMLGRKVQLYDGTRPNLSALFLGEPGGGKTEMAYTIEGLITGAGYARNLQRNIVSGPALEEALACTPNLLLVRDEVQDMFVGAERNPYTRSLLTGIKEVFSASKKESFLLRRKASEKQMDPIPYPSLTALFMGTPAAMKEAITDRFYEDGFMARMLLLFANEAAPVNLNVDAGKPPAALIDVIRTWQNSSVFEDMGRDGEMPQIAQVIPCTEAARKRLAEIKREWQVRGEGVELQLRRRGQELICKLCLIAATSEDPAREIDLPIVERCEALIDAIIGLKIRDWEGRSFGDEKWMQLLKKVPAFVKEKDGAVRWRTAYRKFHLRLAAWSDLVLALIHRGDLQSDAEITADGYKFKKSGKWVWIPGCKPDHL